MKTLFLHSPTMPNTTNEASLDTLLPHDVLGIIFDQIVNQSHSMPDISSILLTCKKWKHIFEKNPCISLLQTLFQFKEKHPFPITFPQECIQTKQKERFTPQEFKLIDQVLFDRRFGLEKLEKLLMVDSQLFHPKSLFLSLLDRYSWDPKVCITSANQNIRQVAKKQLSILNSLVSGSDEQRLTIIKNEFIKKLYCGGRATEKWSLVKDSIISTLKKIPNFNDKEIFMHIGHCFGRSVFDIRDSLKEDRDIVLAVVQQDGRALVDYADESFKKDREIVLAAVQQNGWVLEYAYESLQSDREIILAAVNQCGWALEYADESLRKNREIVLAAVKQNSRALAYADESLQSDREIVLAAIQQNSITLQYANASFKKDREIVLAAVQQAGCALEFADESLQNDQEIVLAAVQQAGRALQYADESLQNDQEIVLAAVQQAGRALHYADESLQSDREIVLAAVQQAGCALEFAGESLQSDREIVLAAVQQDGWALKYADESLKKDRDIVLAAIQQDGRVLQFADESFQNDQEIVLIAVKQDGA